MPRAPLSPLQWLVWSLSTEGQFFEGMNPFMGDMALPLVKAEFGLGYAAHAAMASATLAGSC